MTEKVTIFPVVGNDDNGDPLPEGAPIVVTPLEVAPGNAVLKYGVGGDLQNIEFTVFLELRHESNIKTGDEMLVRGRRCVAAVQIWRSQQSPNQGGIAVLATSASGKASP
ncbi:MAG TPA: hypothetical protein VMV33_03840 [Rhodocyclaceae bacterium]|jgi:hypothetical protein|nr:hypothetical protein [Rhodocyclaceae bacterium]